MNDQNSTTRPKNDTIPDPSVNKSMMLQRFMQSEHNIEHPTYDSELSFYHLVSSGNFEAVKHYDYLDVDAVERGILSDNPLQNLKYHAVVTIAMICRFCIEDGMEESISYNLSDYYIKRLDNASDQRTIREIYYKACVDYAERMSRIQKYKSMSIYCVKAVDYVNNHLHERIQAADVAAYVGLEQAYFSRLFHKEMEVTPSQYIRDKKIQTAKSMLMYSDYSCSEISQYLAFSDGSHFALTFRKVTGETPDNFRKKNYRKHWTR